MCSWAIVACLVVVEGSPVVVVVVAVAVEEGIRLVAVEGSLVVGEALGFDKCSVVGLVVEGIRLVVLVVEGNRLVVAVVGGILVAEACLVVGEAFLVRGCKNSWANRLVAVEGIPVVGAFLVAGAYLVVEGVDSPWVVAVVAGWGCKCPSDLVGAVAVAVEEGIRSSWGFVVVVEVVASCLGVVVVEGSLVAFVEGVVGKEKVVVEAYRSSWASVEEADRPQVAVS